MEREKTGIFFPIDIVDPIDNIVILGEKNRLLGAAVFFPFQRMKKKMKETQMRIVFSRETEKGVEISNTATSRYLNSTQAKAMLPHGEFGNWLDSNFGLSQRTANNFMACAERFGNSPTSANLNQSQMIEMLALPAGETEKFIEEKAAEGTPVEDMTVEWQKF